ncbi:MAG: hypothetical protein ACM3IH_13810 [Sphingobacteriales bacterium]|jgi:hypothetical protein
MAAFFLARRGVACAARLAGFYALPRKICAGGTPGWSIRRPRFHIGRGIRMLTIIGGALVAGASAGFWYLLPRNGKEHRLVENSGVGSMATIVILTLFTIGVALFCDGMFG